MKEIKAYVRKAMRDPTIDALEQVEGLPGLAIVPVQEFGHSVGTGRLERIEMIKIEMDVPEHLVEAVVTIIEETARTGEGHHGDGRIVVLDVSDAVRIEDGVRGDVALHAHGPHRHSG